MKNAMLLAAFIFCLQEGHSQRNEPSVINSAGGSYQAGYFQFEWSIGEMSLIGQLSDADNTLTITNGFIQPYILHPGSYNTSNFFGDDEIKIFPNPASEYAEINFFTRQQGRVTLNFFDAGGKKIYSRTLTAAGVDLIERIPVKHLANGTYILEIRLEANRDHISKMGIYKIVKSL